MENNTITHRPDGNSARCTCGGEEQYFEDATPPGYGCEVEGRTYGRTLDRLGWHIPSHRRTIAESIGDRNLNTLSNDEWTAYERYLRENR